MSASLRVLLLTLPLAMAAPVLVHAHGDAAPQPVDTTGLKPLGDDVVATNPYVGNAKAVEIGASGYNKNCARCHGLDVKSGGMAPDLRELPHDEATDSYFISRVMNGAERDGRYRMPPFHGILSQEAIWAIRTYIENQGDADHVQTN